MENVNVEINQNKVVARRKIKKGEVIAVEKPQIMCHYQDQVLIFQIWSKLKWMVGYQGLQLLFEIV